MTQPSCERVCRLAEKLFGGTAHALIERTDDKWRLTVDVGGLEMRFTGWTRREVLDDAQEVLGRAVES